jgi:hypothetical protein
MERDEHSEDYERKKKVEKVEKVFHLESFTAKFTAYEKTGVGIGREDLAKGRFHDVREASKGISASPFDVQEGYFAREEKTNSFFVGGIKDARHDPALFLGLDAHPNRGITLRIEGVKMIRPEIS